MADIGATRSKLSITPWQAFQRQGAGNTSDDGNMFNQNKFLYVTEVH